MTFDPARYVEGHERLGFELLVILKPDGTPQGVQMNEPENPLNDDDEAIRFQLHLERCPDCKYDRDNERLLADYLAATGRAAQIPPDAPGFSRRSVLAGAATIPLAGAVAVPALAYEADAELVELGRKWDALKAEIRELERPEREAYERAEAMEPPKPEALRIRPDDDRLIGRWLTSKPTEWNYNVRDGFYDPSPKRIAELKKTRCALPVFRDFRVGTWEELTQEETRDLRPLRDFVMVNTGEDKFFPDAQARIDEIVAAWDEWQAAINAARKQAGVNDPAFDALEAASDELEDELSEVEKAIAALPAATVAGLYVKARMAAEWDCWRHQDPLWTHDDPERGTDERLTMGIFRDLRAMAGGTS